MIENFYNALADALRADPTLVTLTEHTVSDFRIVRGPIPREAEYPTLAFEDLQTTPTFSDAVTAQKDTVVSLQAASKDIATAVRIADRLDVLLTKETTAQNVQYFNITNATVKNNWTYWRSRGNPVLDEDKDVWEVTTVADFSWHLTSP